MYIFSENIYINVNAMNKDVITLILLRINVKQSIKKVIPKPIFLHDFENL